MEHSSNDLPWRTVPGHTMLRIGMDQDGFLDLKELAQVLKAYNEEKKYGQKRIRILALTAASNLLGTCNDVEEICRLAHQYGARVSMDMAQWVAHRPVNMLESGIDFLVFSGHKMYAPFGTGVLVCPKNWMGEEMLTAQFFPENNAAGIAALGKAMQLFQRIGFDRIIEEEQALIIRMFPRLSLPGMVRGSIGLANTAEEVDAFLEALQRIASGQANKESKGRPAEKKKRKHSMQEYRNTLIEKVFPEA